MRLRILFLFLVMLISLNIAKSDFSAQLGYGWLINQSNNGSFSGNVFDTSLALLALSTANDVEAEKAANYIETRISLDGCLPAGNCRVKETAMAMIALNEAGRNIQNIEGWLVNAQTASLLNGNWNLQIVTSDSGICKFRYIRNNQEVAKDILVDKGKFPSCGNNTWLDINTCLDSGLVGKEASLLISVDCRALDDAIISLIYNNANSYYIREEVHGKQADIGLKNGCYGITSGASCSYIDTLYADWALNKLNSNTNSKFYLDLNYDNTNVLHSSLLHLITSGNPFLEDLRDRQRRDGSFDNNIFNTALAVLSLKASSQDSAENATNWLKSKQQADGSWGNVPNTALALYAAFPRATLDECSLGETRLCGLQSGVCTDSRETCVEGQFLGCNYGNLENFESLEISCDDNLDNDCDASADEEDTDCAAVAVCNLDDVCDFDLGENEENCPQDCLTNRVCNLDDVCDFDLGEDVDNCPSDCEAEADTCDNGIKDQGEEGIDCGGVCTRDCTVLKAECNEDNTCELEFGENALDCPEDCRCGDKVCDTSEDEDSCQVDCGVVEKGEKEAGEEPVEGEKAPSKGFPLWIIWVFLIILIGVYLYYIKFVRKPPKREFGFDKYEPKKGSGFRFRIPFITSKKEKSGLEKEIDESIEEAQSLIKR